MGRLGAGRHVSKARACVPAAALGLAAGARGPVHPCHCRLACSGTFGVYASKMLLAHDMQQLGLSPCLLLTTCGLQLVCEAPPS